MKILGIAFFWLTATNYAFASQRPAVPIEELAKEANFIFSGEVVQVRYKNSAPDLQQKNGLPHTFVTYRVHSVVKGALRPQFTLRVLGGLKQNGEAMTISHFPTFDVGERDILFVRGNSAYACPMVRCELGRFRVEQGKVFSDDGRGVLMHASGSLGLGGPQFLRSASTHTFVHPTTGQSTTVTLKGNDIQPVTPEANQLSEANFLSYLKKAVAGLPAANEPSVDFNTVIPPINLMPSQPPLLATPSQVSPRDQQEVLEMKRLSQNNGNPVIQ